jgi:hypothetical protein
MVKMKVMKLIDSTTGLMECTVCHETHYSELSALGHFKRGSWQCVNGCQPDILGKVLKRLERIIKKTENIELQYKKMEIRKKKFSEAIERKRKKKTE